MDIQSSNYLLLSQALLSAALSKQDTSASSVSSLSNQTFLTLIESMLQQAAMTDSTGQQDFSLLPNQLSTNLPKTTYSPTIGGPQVSLSYGTTNPSALNGQLKGALAKSASLFEQAGKTYGINPALLAAISMHETGNGNSRAVQVKNNPAGMMGKDGLKSYASLQDGIFDMARNLRKNYLDEGKTSIADIGAKYAPIGSENDPGNLNSYWVKGVQYYYDQLTKQTTV
ncbi:glucosaminidase domain-containing protein [Ectobacillus sp. sgz5001026]|uniref:glucosaminidase domain-containing protein n=1 Tax=Ectobacillus sp. sgz5001026 TaxID=3242473 RepID=UPI0036D306B6